MFRKWFDRIRHPSKSRRQKQAAHRHVDVESAWQIVVGDDNAITAVDVGGANNLQPHWHKLIGISRFIVYEPHEASFLVVIEQQKVDPRYSNFRYLNEALSGSGGARTLYKTNAPTGSSLYPPRPGSLGDYPANSYFYPISEIQIETKSLEQSLDGLDLKRVDIIKLDTQGSELEILRGLDDDRLEEVLAIECEIGILNTYDTENADFKDYLEFMETKGFVLFDLRVNRFLGNATRIDANCLARVLGTKLNLPPIAHRINEVDAVFFRDPRILLESNPNPEKVRRLLALLLTYNFLPEAVFTVQTAKDRAIFDQDKAEDMFRAIGDLREIFGNDARDTAEMIERNGGQIWAQYMWVPYPSS